MLEENNLRRNGLDAGNESNWTSLIVSDGKNNILFKIERDKVSDDRVQTGVVYLRRQVSK